MNVDLTGQSDNHRMRRKEKTEAEVFSQMLLAALFNVGVPVVLSNHLGNVGSVGSNWGWRCLLIPASFVFLRTNRPLFIWKRRER